jgi:hypothetical protein
MQRNTLARATALLFAITLATPQPALAETVKGKASPNGSKVFAWVQDENGPAVLTAALKSKRVTGMVVFDADELFYCFSIGGVSDRVLRCEFDAVRGEVYGVFLLTGSGSNKFDLSVQSGGSENVRMGESVEIPAGVLAQARNQVR